MTDPLRLAVVGDIHGFWSPRDVDYFNRSDYHAILLVGDLPTIKHWTIGAVADSVAQLAKPAFFIPGNHDGTGVAQLVAEVLNLPFLAPLGPVRQDLRMRRLTRRLAPVTVGGYSVYRLGRQEHDTALLVARPHAMGGGLSFGGYLRRRFGIGTLDESADRLCQLIDERPESRIIVLAHNGPSGLGDQPTDPWGCDFKRGLYDWGDGDLRRAIEHAKALGKQVLAVVAGHMHQRTKQGEHRTWRVRDNGTLYVNAARVPRFRKAGTPNEARHHIALALDGPACEAEAVWVA